MNFEISDIVQNVIEAEKRIKTHIRETPVEFSPYLSKIGDCNLYLKLENQQLTGSFKLRGALNKVLSLPREKPVITASTGNHGLAMVHALNIVKGSGSIYLPKNTAKTKIDALSYGKAELFFHGNDSAESETYARKIAEKEGKLFISPYNDIEIIGGQGTIAVELIKQVEKIDALLVSVGGGGLISGIAGYLKSINPDVDVIACFPENSAVMFESIKRNGIVEMVSKPTLSDGTAGGVEKGSITFSFCKELIDEFILVTEEEIADAIRLILDKHHMIIEGAAGVTVASFLKNKEKFKNKNVVLILCGANIGFEQLKKIICTK